MLSGEGNNAYIFAGTCLAIIFMAVYLILESVNLGRTLKALGEKSNIFKNFKYALIGFFFSAITPAASGGQPMQIYYMHKDKISVANSTLALLVNLCSFQIITLTFAFISVFLNTSHLNSGLVCFFIIGVSLNMSALALLLIGIFSKKLSAALIRFAEKILKKFCIYKATAKSVSALSAAAAVFNSFLKITSFCLRPSREACSP